MNEIIYLEPDDDITAVIGRLKEIAPQAVALVIPRGSNIAQSVVNLKLLKREIGKIGKEVSLVTTDKISRNLASQVGVSVYSSVTEAKNVRLQEHFSEDIEQKNGPDHLKINRYNKDEEVPITVTTTEGDGLEKVVAPENFRTEEIEPENIKEKITIPISETDKPIEKNEQHSIKSTAPLGSRFRSKNVSSRRKPLIIIAIIFVVVVLGLLTVFLPKAVASIILKTENIANNSTITLDKNITMADQANLVLPSTLISIDDTLTKEFTATGSKNMGTKAVGEVVFYNEDCDSPQKIIPAGTALTASGKNFVTGAEATLKSAECTTSGGTITKRTITTSGKISITATEPGEEYNLPASRLNLVSYTIAQRNLTYAQTSVALSGGTNKKVTTVSDDDILKAKEATKAELDTNLNQKILTQAEKDGKKIITSSVAITDASATASKQAGEEASGFTYNIATKGEAIAFDESEVRAMIVNKITAELGVEQMIINSEKAEINYVLREAKIAEGKMVIDTMFIGKKGKKYNSDIIKKQITNKKFGSALSTVQNLAEVEKAEIVIWPKFFPRTPILESRVKVNFDYIK